METRTTSLLDTSGQTLSGRKIDTAHGSRLIYAARCHLAAVKYSNFLYDAVGPARAHPRMPGLRRPYGLWMHGNEVWHSLSPSRKRALRGADFVLVNSRFTLDRFREIHGHLENAQLCWLATEEDDPPCQLPKPDCPPTALILGRIVEDPGYKGHGELIECWGEVCKEIPGARLLIAGDGPGRERLIEMVNSSAAGNEISICGFVDEADLDDLWAQCDLFVMTGRGEGFGLVYAEAMRRSLPVIASVHDAGSEINLDGITGYNVDQSRPGELAARIIELLKSRRLARQMGQNGHLRWQQNFRFSVFKKRFLEKLSLGIGGGLKNGI